MYNTTQDQLKKCEFYLRSEREAKQSYRVMSLVAQKKSADEIDQLKKDLHTSLEDLLEKNQSTDTKKKTQVI